MIPSPHNHAGHMVFSREWARCTECGARWRLAAGKWFCVESGKWPEVDAGSNET